jgi:glycosyltransferase 2 family protein
LISKLRKKIFFSLAFGGALYLAFTIYADYEQVLNSFSKFNLLLLPLLLLLSFLNYSARFFKWDFYLSVVGIRLKKLDSFSIFMSGLIMSVTPGKLGELLKAYLVKEVHNDPISKTAPIIFAERITDFLSLLVISITGAMVYNYGGKISFIVAGFFILLIIIISNKKIALPLLGLLEKIKLFKKYIHSIHTAYESAYKLLKIKPLLLMTFISLISWGFECFGYYIILHNFGVDFGILWASFSYCFAIVIGAISMLPGGLGVTEGSLTYFLIEKNVAANIAVTTTFLIRVVTLWFAVLIGIFAVSFYQKRFGKISIENV